MAVMISGWYRYFLIKRLRCSLLQTSSTTHGFKTDIAGIQDVQKLYQNEEIVIPKQIKRNSTDILKALSSTLQRDYTSAHYKYHDDPYLIPASNIAKRTYALAKESGKKAAAYFLENYPEGFKNDSSEPIVKAFNAPIKYTEDDVTESTLLECIENVEVKNAIIVYQYLSNKGKILSHQIKQSLLELLCFYNCDEPLNEDQTEEKWFRQASRPEKRKTWKDGDLADKLFKSFEEKDSAAYCAMIQGLIKHFYMDQAYALYEEMQAKQLPGSVDLYNSLITLSFFLKEGSDSRWEQAEKFVSSMIQDGITPDLGTINALLDLLSKLPTWRKSKSIALQLFGEMKRLNIEPSLGSFYYLLVIFCKERGPVSLILHDIMDYIKGKEFKIRHSKDVFFFVTAMDVCHNHLMDKDLAYSLHELLELNGNYALIGDSYKESIYYQHFFRLLCNMETIDNFFHIYNKYVPHVYIPEPTVLLEIIQAIDLSEAFHYIPQIWSDVICFQNAGREKIIDAVLSIMAKSKQEMKLQKQYVNIGWDIKERIDSQDPSRVSRNQIQWTGQRLGDILFICLNGGDTEKAWTLMYKMQKEEDKILGYPSLHCLKQFCVYFLQINHFDKVLFCLKYALEAGYNDIGAFIKTEAEKYGISSQYRSKIENILNETPLSTSTIETS